MGFPCYFRPGFLSLSAEHICSLNRFVLTDKEDSEYCSFECLIANQDMFWLSKVMLCTFHAVWQPFKRDVYTLLPEKKPCKHKLIELTEVGKLWGEYQFIINKNLTIIIYDLIYILNFSLAIYLYKIFQHQTYVLNKGTICQITWNMSKMLKWQRCQDSVSHECINVIENFETNMKEKEKYLAFHIWSKILMSFDAITTSPVESMNSSLKNGMGINSNSNTRYKNSWIYVLYKLM